MALALTFGLVFWFLQKGFSKLGQGYDPSCPLLGYGPMGSRPFIKTEGLAALARQTAARGQQAFGVISELVFEAPWAKVSESP